MREPFPHIWLYLLDDLYDPMVSLKNLWKVKSTYFWAIQLVYPKSEPVASYKLNHSQVPYLQLLMHESSHYYSYTTMTYGIHYKSSPCSLTSPIDRQPCLYTLKSRKVSQIPKTIYHFIQTLSHHDRGQLWQNLYHPYQIPSLILSNWPNSFPLSSFKSFVVSKSKSKHFSHLSYPNEVVIYTFFSIKCIIRSHLHGRLITDTIHYSINGNTLISLTS